MTPRSWALLAASATVSPLAAAVAWFVTGESGSALAAALVSLPVPMVLAMLLPLWVARRVGRSLGVGSLGRQAPGRWTLVRNLVLDPFRSLTTGQLVVVEIEALDPDHERNLRWFAGALAHQYDDPVGRAVAKLAGRGRLTDVKLVPGRGIRGSVDRHPVRVGEPQWLGLGAPDAGEGCSFGTTVAVEVDQRPLGRITVAEDVHKEASHQLGQLRQLGFTPVLASLREEAEVERVARLTASPAWHSSTDPARLAKELAIVGTPVGLVAAHPDGSTRLVVVDPDDPAHGGDGLGEVTLVDAAADRVVAALNLLARTDRAQRRGVPLAWVLQLLPVPLAALGLLSPVVAVAVGVCLWLVCAAGLSWGFLGLSGGDVSVGEARDGE